ncbi:MAG: tetratricopeptide repeat protein [Candidatus Omnitrophica bacterium]|nr:tetratricopeptide repeat protein [Candidatus Omnitrophota bacterium]
MLIRAAIIIVLGFTAYASMLHAPFRILDDRTSIVDNPDIKSTKDIPVIFKEGYFHDQSYYRPLVNLSFMGEYHFFRLNSFFYNLDNLILHVLNALLVFLLVSRLADSSWLGFWTGLLFAIHPVQWEAVCNVPGRSILLSAFFELISFILFLEFYKNRRRFCLPLVLVTFLGALLCKESAGMLPFVILGFLALDKTKGWLQKLTCLWPFWAAIAGYLFLRVHFGITVVHEAGRPMVLLLGFVTFLRSVITDLRLFILPVDLHFDRCLPFMTSLLQPQALFTLVFWATAVVLLAVYRRRIPGFVLFLMWWFALELFPVSQLVTSIGVGAGRVSTAEHFLYEAGIPVFIGMVMAAARGHHLNAARRFIRPVLLKVLAAGFLAFLWLTAVGQSIYASNEYTMVKRSLKFEPDNPRLQGVMGMLSVFRGDIPDAAKHFRLAVAAEPFNPQYHIALGTALCQQRRWVEGLAQYMALPPGKNKALVDREAALTMTHIRRQLKEGKTFDSRGWLAIGIYYAKYGHVPQAIDAFQKSAALNPKQTDAWFNLGSLYEVQHNRAAAVMAYKKLLGLNNVTVFQRDFASKYVAIHQ